MWRKYDYGVSFFFFREGLVGFTKAASTVFGPTCSVFISPTPETPNIAPGNICSLVGPIFPTANENSMLKS